MAAENEEKTEEGGSSDEEDCSTGEMDYQEVDPHLEDRELKDHLLRKYSGYLSSLKQEFTKKKKKGKLPKDARQKLLDWWHLHFKWPYPSVINYFIRQCSNRVKSLSQLSIFALDSGVNTFNVTAGE